MLQRHLSKMRSAALLAKALAMHLAFASVRRRDFWLDSKLAPVLQGVPPNILLAAIVVVLGLSAILVTPLLPLIVLGAVAFFLSFDRKATTRFVMMGGLSTAMGSFTIVDFPLSPITSTRLEGLPFMNLLATPNLCTIFCIAAMGAISLLQIELTPVQRDTLTALVHLHRQRNRAVKGEEIAELIKRNPGTIRNQMQSLKSLNLVESITGPKGGYKATEATLEALKWEDIGNGDESEVPIFKNGELVKGVSANEIILNKISQSESQCNSLIRIIGNIKNFEIGDEIKIGPTPVNKIFIHGIVMGLDNAANGLILNVTEIISVPKFPVKKIAKRAFYISPTATLREASKLLVYNGVREALVKDVSPGLINLEDIIKAVANGRTDSVVRDIMSRNFLTINSDELVFDAIKMLSKTGVNQLVVVENGVLWGILAPADIIKSLTSS